MAITYEYGQRVEGEWRTVASNSNEAAKVEIKPGVVYEFIYEIRYKIPIPGISWLQEKIAEAIVRIQMAIKGFEIVYLKVEDSRVIVQCKRKIVDESQQTFFGLGTALGISAIIVSTFLGIGLLLNLIEVRELIKRLPPIVIPTIGAGTLIAIVVILYLLSERRR